MANLLAEARRVSDLAAKVVSAVGEALLAAQQYQESRDPLYAERLLDSLYEGQDACDSLSAGLTLEIQLQFARANSESIEDVVEGPMPSAHEAALRIGLAIGQVAWAVVEAAHPEKIQRGVEYRLPRLFEREEMAGYIEIVASKVIQDFPGHDRLNRLQVLLLMEQARITPSGESPELNDTERSICEAIDRLWDCGLEWPTIEDVAREAGVAVQTCKQNVAPMVRHGILEKGPNGRGLRYK